MPTLDKLTTGHFGYSATRIEDLGAPEYTLVTIALDVSSSVSDFASELENCLKASVESLKFSSRSDNLMLRVVFFGSTVTEFHGFKLLSEINLSDYDGVIRPHGMTALNDAVFTSVDSLVDYGKKLVDNDYNVNGIVIVVTDGFENYSKTGTGMIASRIRDVQKNEELESLVTILVGVNANSTLDGQLLQFKNDVGFTQYVSAGDATPKTLARLQNFISKSISAQSQALGTGGPSQSLTF